MNFAPLDLVKAEKWQRATFTTYALSLSFFEAVVLDALIRGGSAQALILADVEGVRGCLGELGARRIGKDYEVEPVAVTGGVFHPKVTVLRSDRECHVLIGSGNLTFSGWGGSLEIIEHLHPGFAATALADLAGFFEAFGNSSRVRHHSNAACQTLASELRAAADGQPESPDIRILHSLGTPIGEQLVTLAEDLGGANRLLVAAPFWDDGSAIAQLCTALRLELVAVHAHDHGTVGQAGARSWPTSSRLKLQPVRIEYFGDANERRLHAKALEIACKHGRIVVSGSANCSEAALGRSHNVEVCVARIQRKRAKTWSCQPCAAPKVRLIVAAEQQEGMRTGVLRATLEADELTGDVLTPHMTGIATVFFLGSTGPESLGKVQVGKQGEFRLPVPRLEEESWRGGRLVVRLVDESGRVAEGFVSLASFADIMRRAGMVGRRLLAVIAGTETPADVAAIMEWFHENPGRLTGQTAPSVGVGLVDAGPEFDALVAVSTLGSAEAHTTSALGSGNHASSSRWSRFMGVVMSAFREQRGPLPGAESMEAGDADEEELRDSENDLDEGRQDPDVARALEAFEKLFGVLTASTAPLRNLIVAMELTPFVFNRLRPPAVQARRVLLRLCEASARSDIPPENQPSAVAANIALVGAAFSPHACRMARARLLAIGFDLSGPAPSPREQQDYLAALPPQRLWADLWDAVTHARTYAEQVSAYMQALDSGVPSDGYLDLAEAIPREWPVLEKAIGTGSKTEILLTDQKSSACPSCYMTLPPVEARKLETIGIATAASCCRRVVVRVPDLSVPQ